MLAKKYFSFSLLMPISSLILVIFFPCISAFAQTEPGTVFDRIQFIESPDGGDHRHGQGGLIANRKGDLIFEISFEHASISVYNVLINGSLAFLRAYNNQQTVNGSELDLSGIVNGRLSHDDKFLFITSYTNNAILVFMVSDNGNLELQQIYHDGEYLNEVAQRLRGANALEFSLDGRSLYITASDSAAWTVYAVEGSVLSHPVIHYDSGVEPLKGVTDVIYSADESVLYFTARTSNCFLVYDRKYSGLTQLRNTYCNGEILNSTEQALSGVSDISLSADERTLRVLADGNNTLSIYRLENTYGPITLQSIHSIDQPLSEFYNMTLYQPYAALRSYSDTGRYYMYIKSAPD